MAATTQQLTFTEEEIREGRKKRHRAVTAAATVLQGDEYPDIWRLDDLRDRPKPNWLIRHILEERGLTTLFGPDKVGKTAMLSQFLWSWVAGHDFWFDEKEFTMNDPAEGERSVLYVLLEGQAAFYDRYDAWRNEFDDDGLRLENFFVVDEGLSIFDNAMRWDKMSTWPSSALKLWEAVAVLRPKVLVIDTLSRATAGMDENSPQMANVVGFLDHLRDMFGTATVVVHHVALSDGNRPRGHSSLKGATSSYVLVTGDPAAPTQKLVTGPHRNAESYNPVHGKDYGWPFKRVSHRDAFVIHQAQHQKRTGILDKIIVLIFEEDGITAREAGVELWGEAEDKWKTIYSYIKPETGLSKDADGVLSWEAPAAPSKVEPEII